MIGANEKKKTKKKQTTTGSSGFSCAELVSAQKHMYSGLTALEFMTWRNVSEKGTCPI